MSTDKRVQIFDEIVGISHNAYTRKKDMNSITPSPAMGKY